MDSAARHLPRPEVSHICAHPRGNTMQQMLWSPHASRYQPGGTSSSGSPRWRLRAHPNPRDVQMAFANSALIECACDIWNLALRLEGREATAGIKTLGVDYLLINDSDSYAEDFRPQSSLWGLRLVGEINAARLYFIE